MVGNLNGRLTQIRTTNRNASTVNAVASWSEAVPCRFRLVHDGP